MQPYDVDIRPRSRGPSGDLVIRATVDLVSPATPRKIECVDARHSGEKLAARVQRRRIDLDGDGAPVVVEADDHGPATAPTPSGAGVPGDPARRHHADVF